MTRPDWRAAATQLFTDNFDTATISSLMLCRCGGPRVGLRRDGRPRARPGVPPRVRRRHQPQHPLRLGHGRPRPQAPAASWLQVREEFGLNLNIPTDVTTGAGWAGARASSTWCYRCTTTARSTSPPRGTTRG